MTWNFGTPSLEKILDQHARGGWSLDLFRCFLLVTSACSVPPRRRMGGQVTLVVRSVCGREKVGRWTGEREVDGGRSTLTECGHRDLHFAIKRYRLEQICSLGVGRKQEVGMSRFKGRRKWKRRAPRSSLAYFPFFARPVVRRGFAAAQLPLQSR